MLKKMLRGIFILLIFSSVANATNPVLQPTTSNPVDNAIGVATDANIVLDFQIAVWSGSINAKVELYKNGGTLIESFTATNAFEFVGNQGGYGAIVGDKITLNPKSDLINGNSYYILIPNGSDIRDDAGHRNLVVLVTDPTTYNFTVEITLTLADIVDKNVTEDDSNFTIELNATVSNGNAITYSATSSNTNIATVSISDKNLTITPVANANGVVRIDVNATANGASVTKSFDVNITAVDDTPVLTDIANITKTEDASNFVIELNATDIEGDSISYTATSSNTNIATVSISDNNLTIIPVANANGVVRIDVNATANGASVTKSFDVNIIAVNDIPVIDTSFNDLVLNEDNGSSSYDINISDIEGSDLNLTIESNNTNILTVTPNWNGKIVKGDYQSKDFNLTTVENANGIVKITIRLSDGTDTTTKSFDVNVTAVNDIPTVTSTPVTTATPTPITTPTPDTWYEEREEGDSRTFDVVTSEDNHVIITIAEQNILDGLSFEVLNKGESTEHLLITQESIGADIGAYTDVVYRAYIRVASDGSIETGYERLCGDEGCSTAQREDPTPPVGRESSQHATMRATSQAENQEHGSSQVVIIIDIIL